MDSPYANVGERLVGQGFSAIPCAPGRKIPGALILADEGLKWIGMSDWREKYNARLPTQIEIDVWSGWKEAGVCVVCGGKSRLVAVDIDTTDSAMQTAIYAALPETDFGKFGAKGETLFYRMPEGIDIPSENFVLKIGNDNVKVVEILSSTRQTVLPPTLHPDTGLPYRWTRGHSLEEVSPEQLPVITPADILNLREALKPFSSSPVATMRVATVGKSHAETPHRSLNDHAMNRLDVWIPKLNLYDCKEARGGYEAVPTWRASNTGRPTEQRKRSLKIHPTGIVDQGAGVGYTPIDLVIASTGGSLDSAFGWLSDVTGWSAGLQGELFANQPLQARPVAEKVIIADPVADIVDPAMLPAVVPEAEDLTQVPGILGEIIEWVVARSVSPSRTLALGAALSIVGTLVSRRWAGPTMSGTHLYIIGVTRSGGGKDGPLTAIPAALRAAGAQQCYSAEFESMSACIQHLSEKPISVVTMDEMGIWLKKINHKKASSHESGIAKIVRTVWNRSFQSYQTPSFASRQSVEIFAPAMSIFGASTQKELFEGFAEGNRSDGTLNRFLILTEHDKPKKRSIDPSAIPVPERLKRSLKDLWENGWDGMQLASLMNREWTDPPKVVPWGDGAHEAYQALLDRIESLVEADPDKGDFLARTAEIAIRLATIRSIGVDFDDPMITLDDFLWGQKVAMQSARSMFEDANDLLGASEVQITRTEIMRYIKDQGGKEIRGVDLHKTVGRRHKTKEFNEILQGMVSDSQQLTLSRGLDRQGKLQSYYSLI